MSSHIQSAGLDIMLVRGGVGEGRGLVHGGWVEAKAKQQSIETKQAN